MKKSVGEFIGDMFVNIFLLGIYGVYLGIPLYMIYLIIKGK